MNDTSREAFEKFLASDEGVVKFGLELSDTYKKLAWEGWQACEADMENGNSIDTVAFLTMVQNSAGIKLGIWGDEWLEWYKPERWLNIERALAAFVGIKIAAQAEQVKQEPYCYEYLVNNTHYNYTTLKPPIDTYDEGSLVPLYISPPNQAKLIAELVEVLKNIQLNTVERWTEHTCDIALAKAKKG
jgi:hypothetical protein